MTITGAQGSVRWGYHRACDLRAWVVTTQDDGSLTLSAIVDTSDPFRLSQQPLVFEAPHAQGAWRWPIDSLQIEGVALTARLGLRH